MKKYKDKIILKYIIYILNKTSLLIVIFYPCSIPPLILIFFYPIKVLISISSPNTAF